MKTYTFTDRNDIETEFETAEELSSLLKNTGLKGIWPNWIAAMLLKGINELFGSGWSWRQNTEAEE